jgi:formylglycine-generating enzyme required for sulfatase activity
MSDHDSGEYELAEVPEPCQPKPTPPAAEPLPRLWKTEPDEDHHESSPGSDKGKKENADAEQPVRSGEARQRPKAAKANEGKHAPAGEGAEKKVLIEETPALDTYEARQRARLIVGGLGASCFLIFGWIFYQLVLYDPNAGDVSTEEPPIAAFAPPPKQDLELEARNMFDGAQDKAKAGNTKEATRLLEQISKSYRGTKTAAEANEALERPKHNLPLFLDRPAVKAEIAPKPEAPPEPPPPAIVKAEPRQTAGNATLTPPANPAEPTPAQTPSVAIAAGPGGGTISQVPVRTLPDGFSAGSGAGLHSSGWPLVIVGKRDGAPMMLVPGGTFTMGNDRGTPAEAPAHKVRLSSYYIDQHEVTVRQFQLFLAETHHHGQPPRSWSEDFRKNPSESLPMVMVNARDAQAYADWAQKKLPTEAQWEMAARSTDGRLYPWGADPAVGARIRAASQLEPVKSLSADVSPYGVYDLGGSVLEWTKDWYDSKYYRQLSRGKVDNPTGPQARPKSLELVVKGDRKTGSASSRQGINLDKRLTYVGFRCVLPVTDQGASATPGGTAPGSAPAPSAPGQPSPTQSGAGKTQPPPVPF